MNLIEALPLGILEGVTEFLPVSSTGHLAIAEGLLGLKVDDPGVTAFTAIIQVGAILAVIIYFRSDIGRLASAWLRGLVNGKTREAPDYRFAWYVILGLIPIGIVRLSSQRPDLGASAQLVGRGGGGGGGARGLERGDVDRRAGRQAGSPGVLPQPEGRSDHRFGAVRCPDSRCVSFRGNHQR
ncbi:MAG TPA: undecaprenyl-diphosphate phosphatase, partial [Propionibacteriaceae bacterium]